MSCQCPKKKTLIEKKKKVEKTHQRIFSCVFFYGTEEKVVVRFEGEKGQDAIYEITLCKYLDPENELSIDPRIRFLCMAHQKIMDSYRIKSV